MLVGYYTPFAPFFKHIFLGQLLDLTHATGLPPELIFDFIPTVQ